MEDKFKALKAAWEKKEYSVCKEYLQDICEKVNHDILEEIFIENVDTMMTWYRLFIDTGLADAGSENKASEMFFKLHVRVCRSDNPIIQEALSQAFKKSFPDLTPSGFNEDGNLYSLDDLAAAIGITPTQLLREANKFPDVIQELQPIEPPEGNETIH